MPNCIDLGAQANATFTSGDVIGGRLWLHFESPETVKDITVKLEGVSFSRVPIPQEGEDKKKKKKERFALEIHKFLYCSQIVFPPKEVNEASSTRQFTLPTGDHQFDFAIPIPELSGCASIKQPASLSRLVIDNTGIDYARNASSHFVGPLPPALSDMNEIASVRYFLKATVRRTSFLKMNIRLYQPIVYISPDIIIPNVSPNEIRFARRQVAVWMQNPSQEYLAKIKNEPQAEPEKKKKSAFKSLFGKAAKPPVIPEPSTLPLVLDMRFPNYFNPTQPLPIRLFIISMASPQTLPTSSVLYLDELTFKLYATTDTRAQMYSKQHTHSVTLLNKTKMGIQLPISEFSRTSVPNLPDVWEVELPPTLWENVFIPDSVPPTFQTCNITRSYSFEVIAALSMVPGAVPNYVSVVGDIRLLSGISSDKHSRPATNSIPGKVNPVSNTAANGQMLHQQQQQQSLPSASGPDDLPPLYSEVVRNEGAAQTNGATRSGAGAPAAISAASNHNRRTYQQSNSYFSGLENFDPDSKN